MTRQSAELASKALQAAENDDLSARAKLGARERLAREAAERSRLRTRRIVLRAAAAVLVIGAVATAFILPAKLRKPVQVAPQPEPPGATLLSQTVSLSHVTKHIRVVTATHEAIDVQLLIFDQNRFLKRQAALVDEEGFRNTLRSLKDRLQRRWIVVFAGASMEGDPEDNLKLCRERVASVTSWLKENVSNSTAYWVLPVGEFQEIRSGKEASEEDEDRYAREIGEEQLRKQRQLILIDIAPNDRPEQAQKTVENSITQLRASGLLPTNYDYGTSMPAPFGTVTQS